jgi:hypothetical protein
MPWTAPLARHEGLPALATWRMTLSEQETGASFPPQAGWVQAGRHIKKPTSGKPEIGAQF